MRLSSDVIKTTASVVSILGALVAIIAYVIRLDGRVSRLEEQIHSLQASSAATVSALAEASKKPATAINPIQQECAELAQQADSGRYDTGMVIKFGEDVARRAIVLMEKLGCGSTVR